jgi:hypothetical protein
LGVAAVYDCDQVAGRDLVAAFDVVSSEASRLLGAVVRERLEHRRPPPTPRPEANAARRAR